MKNSIYLDNHSTTPLDPRVLNEMMPYFTEKFGNPSSIDHIYGNEAAVAVIESKKYVQELINANDPEEIIFTSGATESDNLALFGIADALHNKGNHIITTKIEHKAVLDACTRLEQQGFKITYLPVNALGQIDLDDLKKAILPTTILISIMAANNEIGVIAPLKEIGLIAKSNNIIFHTDAAQALGYIPIDVKDMNIDLLSISGHKMYGPKGIGALYVKRGIKLTSQMYGGGQQRGLRSGTLNTPGIVGLGIAAKYAKIERTENYNKLKKLRDELLRLLCSEKGIELNGDSNNRLPHNLNIYIKDVEAKALINEVKDIISVSAGSACTSESVKASYVILALGHDEDRAYSTIRIGLGKNTTSKDINIAAEAILSSVKKLRNL